MNVLNAIASYFRPMGERVRDHRRENLERANQIAARNLLNDERKYWRERMAKAATPDAVKEAREQLDMLNEMEFSLRA